MTDINATIARQVDQYFTLRRLEQAAANQTSTDNEAA